MRNRHLTPNPFAISDKSFFAAILTVILTAILISALSVAMAGCGGASQRVDPPAIQMSREVTEPIQGPLGAKPATRTTRTSVTSTGAGTYIHGTEIKGNFESTPPAFTFPGPETGGSASGGTTKGKVSILGNIPIIPILFGLASLVSFCGTLYQVRLGHLRDAAYAFIAAIAFGCIAYNPDLLPLAGLAILGLLAVWFIRNRSTHQLEEASRAMLEAGQKSLPNFRDHVKSVATLPSDLSVFDRLRRKDNL